LCDPNPTDMIAAVQFKYGAPEEVIVQEVPTPSPKANEVLIKVMGATVNRTDCGFRAGKPYAVRFFSGLLKPKIPSLGYEFAGIVEAIGDKVTTYKKGDELFGMTENKFGAHAQYMVLPEDYPMTYKPKNMTFEEAGAICEGHFYALNYFNAINVQKGDRILINGGSGMIGSSSIQLAKYFVAVITTVVGTKNVELAKELGANKVIDYQKEDFTKSKETYQYIMDSVGKSTFSKCKHLLEPNGIYTSTELGPNGQNVFLSLWTSIYGNKKVIFPIPKQKKKEIEFFRELAEAGHIKAVIDRRYDLKDIVEAYKYVETGEKTGAVVINIPH